MIAIDAIPAETREHILEHFRNRKPGGRAPGANAPDEKPPNSADMGQSVGPRAGTSYAIFGADTRERITSTASYPFRTIGFLQGAARER